MAAEMNCSPLNYQVESAIIESAFANFCFNYGVKKQASIIISYIYVACSKLSIGLSKRTAAEHQLLLHDSSLYHGMQQKVFKVDNSIKAALKNWHTIFFLQVLSVVVCTCSISQRIVSAI